MQLYFMRHGIAIEPDDWDGDDTTRPLLEEGKIKTGQVVTALKNRGELQVDGIWSSPLTRALQTAEITCNLLELDVKIVPELASGASLRRLQAVIERTNPLPECLLLVGHEPDFGAMIGALNGDPEGDYALKKGGVALLEGAFARRGMKLLWLLAPAEILKA